MARKFILFVFITLGLWTLPAGAAAQVDRPNIIGTSGTFSAAMTRG